MARFFRYVGLFFWLLCAFFFCLLGALCQKIIRKIVQIKLKTDPVKPSQTFEQIWTKIFRQLASCSGVKKIIIHGSLCPDAHVLVCNHISYIDILVLRGICACRFVAKKEIAQWPLIGFIAKHLGCVFSSRNSKEIRHDIHQFEQSLFHKNPILFFPESTTADGCRILPFKSAYFNLPPGCTVQPISLRYTTINGLPANRLKKKLYSWRGDISLVNHLWYILGISHVAVDVFFHMPLLCQGNRKALAKQCFDFVQQGVHHDHAGDRPN